MAPAKHGKRTQSLLNDRFGVSDSLGTTECGNYTGAFRQLAKSAPQAPYDCPCYTRRQTSQMLRLDSGNRFVSSPAQVCFKTPVHADAAAERHRNSAPTQMNTGWPTPSPPDFACECVVKSSTSCCNSLCQIRTWPLNECRILLHNTELAFPNKIHRLGVLSASQVARWCRNTLQPSRCGASGIPKTH